jgi:hypothetical protein
MPSTLFVAMGSAEDTAWCEDDFNAVIPIPDAQLRIVE